MKFFTLFLLSVITAQAQVPDVVPAFPNSLTGTPGTLLFRQINLNRVTNIAYHNGLIYTHEVGGGNPRRWVFTDINDPATLTNVLTGNGVGPFTDHGTHGHFKVGDWLGGQFGIEIRRDTPGVNVLETLPGFTYLNAETLAQPGDGISRMYYPWGTPFNWIEYGAATGNGFLYRGTQKLIEWPALAEHGVTGNSILLGNLLFITSDESDMGILCYDISPAFETPAEEPILLDKLSGPIGAYIASMWENYIVLSRRSGIVDIVDISDPTNLQFVTSIDATGDPDQDLNNGLGYIQCQDNFVFTDRHKIDMDTFQTVLEFDEVGDNRPAGSIAGMLDTSQRMTPIGNLLLTGGYSISGADGVGVWIHDANPDTNPPYVGYHVPRPGQTDFPLGAPISILIHETLESFTIINGETVILRPVGGDPVDATVSFSYDDVLTITPTAYLQDDTTYEVEIVAGGIKDVAGNGILPYTFSFSTGSGVVGGNASPVITSFSASPSPATPGSQVDFTASATDADADSLEYRFTFGESGAVRDWDSSPNASHTYNDVGHYGVKVQVRDIRTAVPLSTVSQTGTVSVAVAPPATAPTKSSPIALNESNRQVWVVNPDNDSVSLIDADTRTLTTEIDLNVLLSIPGSIDPRNIAIDATDNIWVTCRDANRIVVLNPAGTLVEEIFFDYGDTPMGIAISPDGTTAYVTFEGPGELRRYETATRNETGRLPLGPMPRAIAITADGSRVLVTRFISPEDHGEVWDVDAASMTLTRRIALHRDRSRDGSSTGRGVPNYISSITITPAGDYAYYTAIKANTQRGEFFDQGQNTNDPMDPDNSIRAIVGRIDLTTNNEPFVSTIDNYRIDIDNSESPTSIEFTPSGDYFFVSLQGNNHFAVFDDLLIRTLPRNISTKTTKGRFAAGLAPQGLIFDSVTNRLFSTDFMGRTVTVHEMGPFMSFGNRTTNRIVIPKIIGADKLSANVLLGKSVFYQAADGSGLSTLPTMSQEGYISCASCHVDGQHDGMTWDFTQRGEGLRNTTDLRGRFGVGHGNVHWTANFDEIQDFVLDVVNEFGGGEGLLPDGETPNPSLGTPNAGRSTELDALAAYVTSLGNETLPRSPYRNPYSTRTAAAVAGEAVFMSMNCVTCHTSSDYTDSSLGVATLHDVGTLRTSSGQRLNGALTGIDTPTLLGLWASAPYFHNGSAKTLDEVFRVAGGITQQAEDGILGGGANIPSYPRLNEDSSMHGQMVYLDPGDSVTFNNVNGGGNDGMGDLELRWMTSFYGSPGTTTVNVNGIDHQIEVVRPLGNESSANHWQRLRFEDVEFTAGETNTIVITTTGDNAGFDDMTVTTPDGRSAAVHREALNLSEENYDNLIQYLLQLDGSGNVQPPNPTAVIRSVKGDNSMLPYAEFDITFSEPVADFDYSDLLITDSAMSTVNNLITLTEGTHYRLRLAGFTQDGTITVELPAGRVAAVDDGLPNLVAELDSLVHVMSDDIALLSDEFDDPTTISNWQRNYQVEGWGVDKLETWDIDTSRSGYMRAMPYSSSWFRDWTGALAFKEITGDFVVTMQMEVSRRNGLPGRPSSDFSLGGIMIRTPRGISSAAPDPDPGPAVVLPSPSPAFGDPDYYSTDWLSDTENYIFLSFGHTSSTFASVDNTWSCEVKTTIDGDSTLYGVQSGIPENNSLVTLQCIRRGSTFLLLRRHDNGPWIIENRFERTDMPATLQVGLTTYTDWNSVSGQDEFHHNRTVTLGGNPDLVADVDYFRLHRPHASITTEMLEAANITGQYGQPSLLENTALAGLLGDAANGVADGQTYAVWLSEHFTPNELVDPAISDPTVDHDLDRKPNLIDFLTDGNPHGGDPAMDLTLTVDGDIPQLTLGRNTMARGHRMIIEATSDFINWETLLESVNGETPTGPGFISEGTGVMRIMTLQDTENLDAPRFYRINVIEE
ncbi:Ig-like domain-containing protein [Rubellicoccus peritrichatus]|uniref:Ig-like domain-containing protein n=1 Tax=Rubellicoccus peritrichatus TaxID=3080537 RepID=A0AAQ3QTG0_9BACT|nr:Ig-like domain-containing protein [Puniceicoccus sp. CR14]WOO39333.1 Ig-like domain-containing protein [Puniceicoccus sp. CR14]